MESGTADKEHDEDLEGQQSEKGAEHEGGSAGIHEEGGDQNRKTSGPRRSFMPEIALRPPVPFSNGPYPEVLPSGLSEPKQGEEEAPTTRAATDQEETKRDEEGEGEGEGSKGGTRREEERRKVSRAGGDERPGGGWSRIWSPFRTAINGRK